MNLLIVEDEPLLAKQLMALVRDLEPQSTIAAHTNSIASTVTWLQQNKAPDLILMDIELADGQCFEVFKQVPVKTPVVFTTAYNEHALRAFKVNSVDYLLKPVNASELREAFRKWRETAASAVTATHIDVLIRELKKPVVATSYRERFLVRQGRKMVAVDIGEIAYFFAKNTLNFLVTRELQKFAVDYTLDELERLIDPQRFFRANRQYIVAQDIITAIHPWFNGKIKLDTKITMEDAIVISREKAPLFKEWMGA